MLTKPTAKKNNIIRKPAYIAFLKNEKFSSYKNVAIILSILWAFSAMASSGIIQVVSIILLIASVAGIFYIPKVQKKHKNDQFVIEYNWGIHEVNEGIQKKIPWSQVVCFINSYQLVDKKKQSYESVFYIVTTNDYMKLDKTNFTEQQINEMYNLLGPYLNSYQRYIAGENLVTIEMRDIDAIRKRFMGQFLFLQ